MSQSILDLTPACNLNTSLRELVKIDISAYTVPFTSVVLLKSALLRKKLKDEFYRKKNEEGREPDSNFSLPAVSDVDPITRSCKL